MFIDSKHTEEEISLIIKKLFWLSTNICYILVPLSTNISGSWSCNEQKPKLRKKILKYNNRPEPKNNLIIYQEKHNENQAEIQDLKKKKIVASDLNLHLF